MQHPDGSDRNVYQHLRKEKPAGTWKFYDQEGNLIRKVLFKNGKPYKKVKRSFIQTVDSH